jgi:L-ascorbate metabolism protein UlaG (beta-lactamase superfamily)
VAPSSTPTPPSAPRADLGPHDRARELDRLHRGLLRGPAGLVLSLRFLTAAARRLAGRTEPARSVAVSHPPSGVVAVTFVGHATMMLTTPGARILTDPLLETFLLGLRRAKAPGIAAADLDDVSVVLISHAHRDHLNPASLRRLPRAATLVVPPRCADLVRRLGFACVVELGAGHSFTAVDAEITAVPVQHSGVRGLGDYRRRGAGGYVITSHGTTLYFAGDTGYFSGFVEIGRRYRPDVAILPIAGYEPAAFRDEHMSPLDALYAFEDLGAHVMIPMLHGSFPLSYEPLEAPLAWLRGLAREHHLTSEGPGGGEVGGYAIDGTSLDGGRRRLAALDHGETCFFRKRP